MITSWTLANFKSVCERTHLTMRPLTLFTGTNSSGKSSVIQSILLIAQTLAQKTGERSLVLNGSLARLGQFDSLVSDDRVIDNVEIAFTYASKRGAPPPSGLQRGPYPRWNPSRFRTITCDVCFGSGNEAPTDEPPQHLPQLLHTRLTYVSENDIDNVATNSEISIEWPNRRRSKKSSGATTHKAIPSSPPSSDQVVTLDAQSQKHLMSSFPTAEIVGCKCWHFLPSSVMCHMDFAQEMARSMARYLNRHSPNIGIDHMPIPDAVIAVLQHILGSTVDMHEISTEQHDATVDAKRTVRSALTFRALTAFIDALPNDKQTFISEQLRDCTDLQNRLYDVLQSDERFQSAEYNTVDMEAPIFLHQAIDHLQHFFLNSVMYLEPLREAPKLQYPLSPASDPRDIGLRGEHTASVLEAFKGIPIHYISPRWFKSPEGIPQCDVAPLAVAVNEWLAYLEVAESLASHDLGKLGHDLQICTRHSKQLHDLAHVGVGVSQVLPILVMCLLADKGATIIVEQPELHLHPKVEALLGDFLLSLTFCDKQCIVETHSEHLLNRIRFRIAELPTDNTVRNNVIVYFAEKGTRGSSFREVTINEYGAILDWPIGFFDQSQTEAEKILSAAMRKHQCDRGNDNDQ